MRTSQFVSLFLLTLAILLLQVSEIAHILTNVLPNDLRIAAIVCLMISLVTTGIALLSGQE